MRRSPFLENIRNTLHQGLPKNTFRQSLLRKEALLSQIQSLEHARFERSMLRSLKSVYCPPIPEVSSSLKSRILNSIHEKTKQVSVSSPFSFFPKKLSAVVLSVILISSFFIHPIPQHQAQAATLQCTGTVFVNRTPCAEHLVKLSPGDEVATGSGQATITFADLTQVRLDTGTTVVLDPKQIRLIAGSAWLNAPQLSSGGLKVATSLLKMQIPLGSAGIAIDDKVTQLYAATAAVEVQIQKEGSTELLAMAPSTKMIVRSTHSKTQIRQFSFREQNVDWVYNNRVKDHQYIEDVALKTAPFTSALLDSHRAVLEGNFSEAHRLLSELADISASGSFPLSSATGTADLAILNDIADKSPSLAPLVDSIKKNQMQLLKKLVEKNHGTKLSGEVFKKGI